MRCMNEPTRLLYSTPTLPGKRPLKVLRDLVIEKRGGEWEVDGLEMGCSLFVCRELEVGEARSVGVGNG